MEIALRVDALMTESFAVAETIFAVRFGAEIDLSNAPVLHSRNVSLVARDDACAARINLISWPLTVQRCVVERNRRKLSAFRELVAVCEVTQCASRLHPARVTELRKGEESISRVSYERNRKSTKVSRKKPKRSRNSFTCRVRHCALFTSPQSTWKCRQKWKILALFACQSNKAKTKLFSPSKRAERKFARQTTARGSK
jgi:hypothetical protein